MFTACDACIHTIFQIGRGTRPLSFVDHRTSLARGESSMIKRASLNLGCSEGARDSQQPTLHYISTRNLYLLPTILTCKIESKAK